MKLTQARYPHQELGPGTTDMYLAEWSEMAVKFGMPCLAEGLRRTIRDRSRRPFFPTPDEVEGWCRSVKREQMDAEATRKDLARQAEWKAQWEREHAEDGGVRSELTETEKRLNAILSAARAKSEPGSVRYTPPAGHDGYRIAEEFRAGKLRRAEVVEVSE